MIKAWVSYYLWQPMEYQIVKIWERLTLAWWRLTHRRR